MGRDEWKLGIQDSGMKRGVEQEDVVGFGVMIYKWFHTHRIQTHLMWLVLGQGQQ